MVYLSSSTYVEILSDASGTFRCGAYTDLHGWFQLRWPEDWHSVHITAKELVSIVIAGAIWGQHWSHRRVCFKSDNMGVVDLLRSRSSADKLLMHLLHCLILYSAFYRFQFIAEHIPGVLNTAADALSLNNISLFYSLVPQSRPVPLPPVVVDLIVNTRPDWGSQAWTTLFTSSLIRESPHPPEQCTYESGWRHYDKFCTHAVWRNTSSPYRRSPSRIRCPPFPVSQCENSPLILIRC